MYKQDWRQINILWGNKWQACLSLLEVNVLEILQAILSIIYKSHLMNVNTQTHLSVPCIGIKTLCKP